MSARGKFFRQGKYLRPSGEDDDDDDDDDDDSSEDEEDEDEPTKPSAKKTGANGSSNNKSSSANLSSDDDDDDDDQDDDDDDEDEEEEDDDDHAADRKRKKDSSAKGSGASSKGAKRAKVNAFFDEEAEDDDDDDGDDEPYGTHHDPDDIVRKHYTEEDIRREQMDEEARELIRQQDRRRAQAGYRFGADDYDDDDGRGGGRSIQDITRDIEDRHRMSRRTVDRSILDRHPPRGAGMSAHSVHHRHMEDEEGGVGGPEVFSAVSQQSLVPSVSDPSLWMISCAPGKEQELVYQIMNKCIALARQRRPLGICGAIAAQTKGKIYIESYSEPAVVEAIQGVRGLLQYTMRLIPIQDMTTVMTVVAKKKPVKKNEWVRMCRGAYKGDLALVRAVRESGLKCIVQCVPRLDLTLSDLPPEEARIRRRTVRPPQKFFNLQELAAMGKESHRQRYSGLDDIMCDYFEGNYYLQGYLIKEMTVGSMVKPCTDEDPPTLEELQSFRKRPKQGSEYDDDNDEENEGSKMAASLLDELSTLTDLNKAGKKSGGGLLIGDTVEVIEGDLIGLRGKVISMDGTTVKIKPNDAAMDVGGTGEIEFLASQVRKYIGVGARVKVTDGRYANDIGQVVAVNKTDGESDFTLVILTEITHKEITVRTSQVRESAEAAIAPERLQGYELYDLVVLSGGGSANEVGVIVRVGREDFTVINNHGISRDIRPEELRGKRNTTSNRAVALDVQGNQIRSGDSVNVAEGPHKGKTATIKRMSRAQLFLYSQTRSEHAGIFVVRSRSCVLAGSRTQNRGSSGDGGASPFSTPQSNPGRGGPAARGKRDDALIGKTVRIQSGQWKGYLGVVSDATATHVQVELHSRLKKVMVVRERVAVVGDKFGATGEASQNSGMTDASAPTTPFVSGGATPMHGGATPMHGGATPMHDGMGGDEVWRPGAMDQDGSQTTTNGTDEWGADSNEPSSFGTSTNDADDGWGSSSQGGSTWAPTTSESQEETSEDMFQTSNTAAAPAEAPAAAAAAQRDQPRSEMETHVAESDDTAVWFMERVCVQLVSDERPAVIREINSDKTAVVTLEDQSTKTVRFDEVSRVQPKEKDMVLVISGADVGVEGELVCIDGSDAILKDSNEDFKIVDFVHLAKISGES